MKFIDEARIQVSAGDGGRGCISFRREKYIPRGGPDGGNGGKGGNVILVSHAELESLVDFRYKRHYKARAGAHGKGKHQHGREGKDLTIPVPIGTVVLDDASGILLGDLLEPGQKITVAHGGSGGRGNASYVTSTRQAPRCAEPGEPGQQRWIKLELKVLAQVGVIGLPNSGKSTLVSAISAAKPKIAEYPFTTLRPVLGVVSYGEGDTFTVADIPGLIEGAHRGRGLGSGFLRHIERTRVLIHVVDGSPDALHEPLAAIAIIENELKLHNPPLHEKPTIIALNKMDRDGSASRYAELRKHCKDGRRGIFPISARTGEGLQPLMARLVRVLGMAEDA